MDKRGPLISIFMISIIFIISIIYNRIQSTSLEKIHDHILINENFEYKQYSPSSTDMILSRSKYANKLYGFWLGQCIANWTGLVTEMDKIGNIGEIKTGRFYTRDDWGKPDQPNIWSGDKPSELSSNIDFVFEDKNGIWGSDDDTDIEYMYQELLLENISTVKKL